MYSIGLLVDAESAIKSLMQNAMVRALFVRCHVWFMLAGDSTEGVREGFRDWEPCLWQEMEKDKAVRRRLADLRRGRR